MTQETSLLLIMALLASSALNAQQPRPHYTFRPLIQPGTYVANYQFQNDTIIDTALLNDNGSYAAIASWTESDDYHTAVTSSTGTGAQDGEEIDGYIVVNIGPHLALNNRGDIAYTADLFRHDDGKHSRAIFLGRTILYMTPDDDSPLLPFTLTDEGYVIAPPQYYRVAPVTQQESDARFKTAGVNSMPEAPCHLPDFPKPQEWEFGEAVEGPITNHYFDPAAPGRQYVSPVYGTMTRPVRIVYVNRSCAPVLVAISDLAVPGRFELWSGGGLITFERPDGTFRFPGYDGVVTSFFRGDEPPVINNRGQILLRVSLSTGHALLLGTADYH
jgi:hypothetical protein